MNAAVAAGLGAAIERHAGTALVLPGDIPLISADDLRALVEAAGFAPRAVVVAASRDGEGTNALLLRPPNVIAPAFGPPSLSRHIEAGLAAGALTLVRSDLGLSLDVDTPADLAALQVAGPRGHTGAVLDRLGINLDLSSWSI
jgi:2-phospho-L-lactate guanylyltransferase